MEILRIDEKWSIEYDPNDNDRPTRILRYGVDTNEEVSRQKNWFYAMFYKLLGE